MVKLTPTTAIQRISPQNKQMPSTNLITDPELFKTLMCSHKYRLDIVLKTTAVLIPGSWRWNDEGFPPEIYIHRPSQSFCWVNRPCQYPFLLIPTDSDNDEVVNQAMNLASQTLDALVFENSIPIPFSSESSCIIGCSGESEGITVDDHTQITGHNYIHLPAEFENGGDIFLIEWKRAALSYYREAINSDSLIYKYLCFYKVIETAHRNCANKALRGSLKAWSTDFVRQHQRILTLAETTIETLVEKKRVTPDKDVAHILSEYMRNLCAHAGFVGRGKNNYKCIIPSQWEDFTKVREVLPLVQEIAKVCISTKRRWYSE